MEEKEKIKEILPILEKLVRNKSLFGYDGSQPNGRSLEFVDEHSQVVELFDGLEYYIK